MEEEGGFVGIGVNAREIGAFVQIASVASPGKVLQVTASSVLPGPDMLDVERMEKS